MLSTGNDIVSIAAINAERTQEPVFYKKILAETEIVQYQQHYSREISLVNYVWLLWSIKESAYKYLQRLHPEMLFSPTKFVVNNLCCPLTPLAQSFKGLSLERNGFEEETVHTAWVTYNNYVLCSKSIFYSDIVYSVVNNDEAFDTVTWGIKTIDNTDAKSQSEAVRTFLLTKLNTIFIGRQMQISKSEFGFPVILNEQKPMPILVSFSHHKQFVAYSFIGKQSTPY